MSAKALDSTLLHCKQSGRVSARAGRIAVAAAVVLSACSTRTDSNDSAKAPTVFPPLGATASVTVSPEDGGVLTLGDLRLNVPAGALETEETLMVTVVEPKNLQSQMTLFSSVFQFEPEGVHFLTPVAVRIPFEGDASQATFYWSKEEDATSFEALSFAVEGNALVARVSHFSRGFVGGWCQGENCTCQLDRDCVDDGNLCNGTTYTCVSLATASNKKVCKLNLDSLVKPCDTSIDTACSLTTCEPQTGECKPLILNATPCDDQNSCTEETTCQSGVCSGGKNICQCLKNSDCDGSSLCAPEYCDLDSHTCEINPGLVVVCDASENTPCAEAQCNPAIGQCGLVPRNEGKSCPGDGPPCRQFQCQSGVCQFSNSTCECTTDAECDDGNACTAEYCDLSTGTCKANPNAQVVCPSVEDTTCMTNQCNPLSGACEFVARNEGMECSGSGPACVSYQCQSGMCSPTSSNCECLGDDDCVAKSVGALCAGTYYCNAQTNTCVLNPATQVSCSNINDSACLKNQCDNATGNCLMMPVPDGMACDDLNPCTANDSCAAGVCQSGSSSCECEKNDDCPDDGDLCTGAPYCDLTSHTCRNNPALDVTCDSSADTACRQNVCEPTTGLCVFSDVNEGQSCTQQNASPCNQSMCVGGICATFQSQCACVTDEDCAPYQTDLCSPQLRCNVEGYCEEDPTTPPVTCPPYSPDGCSSLSCNPASGTCQATPLPNGTACDDGDPCTGPDQCTLGACVPGPRGC